MIFLTGHKGFIGRNLLKKINTPVMCSDLISDNVFVTLNLTDWTKINKIIHLGAISDTTCKDINHIYEYNILYSQQLLNKAIEYNIPVVYASSASVYGNSLDVINPLNYYALSKSTIDYYVLDNIDKFNKITGLRYFNVYGSDERKGHQSSPIFKFTENIRDGKPIELFEGSEHFYRDFVSVDDVVSITLSELSTGIYDVGTSNPISFAEVARLVAEKYRGEIKTVEFPKHLIGKYQSYTKAKYHIPHKYLTVSEWLNSIT
jgi:ADP-L-glycero-D-manno-heptose 6-epimerase